MDNDSYFPPPRDHWDHPDTPTMPAPAMPLEIPPQDSNGVWSYPIGPSYQTPAYPAYFPLSPWTESPQSPPDSTPNFGNGWNETQPTSRRNSKQQELTPQARERRKAQNRAAQRAFRERKESRIKELVAKLSYIETSHETLEKENEKLKRELLLTLAENELLRVTSPRSENQSPVLPSTCNSPVQSPVSIDCPKNLGSGLLGWKATFQFIQAQETFRDGLVDLERMALKLKYVAKHCDAQALPFFDEADVRLALEQSIDGGDGGV